MLLERAAQMRHGPPAVLDLATEREFAAEVIANIQAAFRRIYNIVLEVARERYPERWTELVPRLVTIANWVGYDTDGRSDIRWSDIVRARLNDAVEQLERYATRAEALATEWPPPRNRRAPRRRSSAWRWRSPRSPSARPRSATWCRRRPTTSTGRAGSTGAWRRSAASGPSTSAPSSTLVEDHRCGGSTEECRLALAVLRAEMANYGMAGAHVHFRVNAIQLTNAIRKEAGIESAPDESADRRRYLRALNDLLDGVKPVTIHFGSILNEGMSARRVFMVLAQLMKYVRRAHAGAFPHRRIRHDLHLAQRALFRAPVRHRRPRRHLAAVRDGKRPGAWPRGHRRAVAQRAFPRLCARARAAVHRDWFSDAGRHIGQVAASLAIERLRIKVGEVMVRMACRTSSSSSCSRPTASRSAAAPIRSASRTGSTTSTRRPGARPSSRPASRSSTRSASKGATATSISPAPIWPSRPCRAFSTMPSRPTPPAPPGPTTSGARTCSMPTPTIRSTSS